MQKIALSLLLLLVSSQLVAQTELTKDKKSAYKIAAIGFYNLENLFDTLDSPNTNDAEFLPNGGNLWNTEKYVSKQANMAKVISLLATETSPDGVAILGVAEIENRKVLEDLVAEPALKSRNYQIVHHESPDERGIDCAFLYQEKYFKVTGSVPYPVILEDPKTGEKDRTRDILYVSGIFDGEPLHLMVGHWPSRRAGESGSAWMRKAAAAVCRHIADSLLAIDPATKIIVMGDLNDDPNNKSLTEVLRAKGKSEDLKEGELYNTMYSHFKNGDGTMAYRDAWSLFDQLIVSQGFVNKKYGGWQLHKSIVFRQPWLLQTEGKYRGYPFRTFDFGVFMNGYSDHLPVYIFIIKRKEPKP